MTKKNFKATNKSRGSKSDSRPIKHDMRIGQKVENHIPGHNDWTWYAPSEQIAKDLASIPFNLITGTIWDSTVKQVKQSTGASMKTTAPTVMAINYALYAGGEVTSATDSINMAAKQLYTAIRKSNSGAKVYEATDVMMYVLAMREVYALYFQIKRILGVVNAYSFLNRAMPEGILHALGLTDEAITDLRSNLASYRGRLNLIAASINSFAIPKYFKVFLRDAYLSSYIFADSTSLAGQLYAFKLSWTRRWDGTAASSGSALVADPITSISSINALMDKLQGHIDALFYDTDINTMAGDVVKAFPESDLYKLGETPEDYVVVPGYDEDVANQINNMVWLAVEDFIQDNSELDISQEDGLIDSVYKFSSEHPLATAFTTDNLIFNSHKDNPDFTDVLEWSRLYNVPLATNTDNTEFSILGGSELITNVEIIHLSVNDGTYRKNNIYSGLTIAMDSAPSESTLLQMINTPVFDWHPYIYVYATVGGKVLQMGYMGDLKRCTFIKPQTLQRIHNAAVYALFNTDRPFTMTKS